MMKKLLALLLCLLLALTAGCAKEIPGGNVQIPSPVKDCATLENSGCYEAFPRQTEAEAAGCPVTL